MLARCARFHRSSYQIRIGSQDAALISARLELSNIDPNRSASITRRAGRAVRNALAATEASAAKLIVQRVWIILCEMRETFALDLAR